MQSPAFVFDFGSHVTRCGFATPQNHLSPRLTNYTLVGYSNESVTATSNAEKHVVFIGNEAKTKKAVCSQIKQPIVDGNISHPEEFRALVERLVQLLEQSRKSPSTSSSSTSQNQQQSQASDDNNNVGNSVVIIEPLFASKVFRRDVAEIFYDLGFKSVLFVSSCASIFATGDLSGLVLDVGLASSRCIAVVDGIALPTSFSVTRLAGDMLTSEMRNEMRNILMTSSAPSSALDYSELIKESVCDVAATAGGVSPSTSASSPTVKKEFTLPDSTIVKLRGEETVRCPEILFQSKNNLDLSSSSVLSASGGGSSSSSSQHLQRHAPNSLPDIVSECALSVDDVIRPHLVSRLTYSGATCSLKGFENRLLFELNAHQLRSAAAQQQEEEINNVSSSSNNFFSIPTTAGTRGKVAPADRAFCGAAIFASLSSTKNLFTSLNEYQEGGVAALSRFRMLSS